MKKRMIIALFSFTVLIMSSCTNNSQNAVEIPVAVETPTVTETPVATETPMVTETPHIVEFPRVHPDLYGMIPPENEMGSMVNSSFSADYMGADSIRQLASWSTDIVHVKVLDERIAPLDTILTPSPELDMIRVYIINQLLIMEAFKGTARPGDIMEVRQLAGVVLRGEWAGSGGVIPLAIGEELVLFLEESSIEGYPHFLVAPSQSAYRFSLSNDGILENAHPWSVFSFPVTIEDLRQLARAS